MPLSAGTRLGAYDILEPLGAGGMGEVYRARDTKLRREVALKVLPEEFARDKERLARFDREARLLASLNHPNIATIYGFEESRGVRYLVMEFADGQPLASRLHAGALEVGDALGIACQIAQAMRAAHEKGILHRDLKPGNVVLTKGGNVKVLDFGLAKEFRREGPDDHEGETRDRLLTRSGAIVGTPAYMSPEQLRGNSVDARTDLFSFGVLLCEMLTGRHPFQGESAADTTAAILREPPTIHGKLPDTLRLVVLKLLAKDSDQRFRSFGEAGAALERFLAEPALLESRPAPIRAFVGRESETAELTAQLERLRSGHGSLVFIGGEPGVGKTRLCEELLGQAAGRGMVTLVGRCHEQEGAQPFLPFIESFERIARLLSRERLSAALGDAAPEVARLVPELRRRLPDIPPPIELPAEQQRRYMFNGVHEFLTRATEGEPLVWLLDDLHWADESSLQLLEHLVSHLETLPILILGTYRDVELQVGRPFQRILATMVRQRRAHRIPLKCLSMTAVAELLTALARQPAPGPLVRVIYDETEGNPFFVEEVFAHLAEEGRLLDEHGEWTSHLTAEDLDVPEGVRLVIGRRLERLSEESRRLLQVAAVVGRAFDLALLEPLADRDADRVLEAAEEAEAAQLVVPDLHDRETRYTFTHELIRQTLVDALSLPRRQRLHLQVAEAMETVYGKRADERSADIAHHLYQAGAAADPQRCIRYLILAGRRALQAAALHEALYYYDTALTLRIEDAKQRADVLFDRGHVQRGGGRPEEALADWRDALALYEKLGASDQVARVSAAIAYVLLWFNRMQEGYDIVRNALIALPEQASHDRCRLLGLAGLVSAPLGEHARANQMLDEAESVARQLADPELEGEMLSLKALSCWGYLDARQGVEAGGRAVELLRPTTSLFWLADALTWTQLALMCSGRLDQVAAMAGETEALIARVYGLFRNPWNCRAVLSLASGDLQGAEEWMTRCLDDTRERGLPWVFWDYTFLGLIGLWSGKLDSALEQLALGLEKDVAPYGWSGMAAPALFLVKSYAGDRSALTLLNADVRLPVEGRHNTSGRLFALSCVVEGLAVLGERERAARLYPLTLEAVGRTTLNNFGLFPVIAAGIAAAAGHNWDAAARHFETAIRQADEIPHRLEQPRARYWYSRMLVDHGDPSDRAKARRLLDEAEAGSRKMGMPLFLTLAQDLSAELARRA